MSTTAAIEKAVLNSLRELPPERQVEVLDFVEFLRRRTAARSILRNPIGLFAHLNIDITEDDIAAARAELWGNFPRDMEL
jgi:hypothetical protein